MPRESPSAVYFIDAIVGILLLIVGILTFVIGIDCLGYLKPITYYGITVPIPTYATLSAWLIVVLGIAGIIYGVKRTIDDIAKGMQPSE